MERRGVRGVMIGPSESFFLPFSVLPLVEDEGFTGDAAGEVGFDCVFDFVDFDFTSSSSLAYGYRMYAYIHTKNIRAKEGSENKSIATEKFPL